MTPVERLYLLGIWEEEDVFEVSPSFWTSSVSAQLEVRMDYHTSWAPGAPPDHAIEKLTLGLGRRW